MQDDDSEEVDLLPLSEIAIVRVNLFRTLYVADSGRSRSLPLLHLLNPCHGREAYTPAGRGPTR